MDKQKIFPVLVAFMFIVSLAACGSERQSAEINTQSIGSVQEAETDLSDAESVDTGMNELYDKEADVSKTTEAMEEVTEMKMNVQVGDTIFTATLEDNAATRELVEMMKQEPVSINMSDYSGFEKVGPLGRSLTTENKQTTTSAGDIVLYSGNQIVMFYGSNSWSYTRIGKIDDLSGWEDALGSGSITAVFTIAE